MIYDGATTTNIYQKMGRGGNLTHIAWPPGIELGPGRITISSCNECVSSRPGDLKRRKISELCIRWGGVIAYICDSMERDRFEPMEGFENKDRGTLWWRTSHRSDTHLRILRVQCPPNGSILNAVLWVKPESGAVFPLCIHVIGLDGVFMSFTSRIRIRSTDPHVHALSIAHTCCHTHAFRRRVAEREVYIP